MKFNFARLQLLFWKGCVHSFFIWVALAASLHRSHTFTLTLQVLCTRVNITYLVISRKILNKSGFLKYTSFNEQTIKEAFASHFMTRFVVYRLINVGVFSYGKNASQDLLKLFSLITFYVMLKLGDKIPKLRFIKFVDRQKALLFQHDRKLLRYFIKYFGHDKCCRRDSDHFIFNSPICLKERIILGKELLPSRSFTQDYFPYDFLKKYLVLQLDCPRLILVAEWRLWPGGCLFGQVKRI